MKQNTQKGVTLIITFFIMTIMLAIVLGISVIMYSGIKIIRNIGNSVVAYYMAESGVEKTFYYDRKFGSTSAARGLCAICSQCNSPSCEDCLLMPKSEDGSGSGCEVNNCGNCEITYSTSFDGGKKYYNVKAVITNDEDLSYLTIDSFGFFGQVSRAIELKNEVKGVAGITGPSISNVSATPRSTPEGIEITIAGDIYDPDGVDEASIEVAVKDSSGIEGLCTIFEPFTLKNEFQHAYEGKYLCPVGVYYVDITACDTLSNCTTLTNI